MRDRILHLADLHLGDRQAYLGSASVQRRAEADALFTRITDAVLDPRSRVGGVLIAGDLFDHFAPPAELVEKILEDLGRLHAAGVRVLTVPGNHDEYSYPDCVYRRFGSRWPDTLVTRPTPGRVVTWTLEGTGIDLYAMAYVVGRSRPPYDVFPVETGPNRKIAVLHGSLDAPWSDRSLPLLSSSLGRLGLDYVALGHIHTPLEQRLESGWVAYPGRIEGGGFHDPGGNDLLEIELGPGDTAVSLHRIAFPSRRIESLEWNVSGFSSREELEERLEGEAGNDGSRILRLALRGVAGFPLDANRLGERWSSRFFHLEIVPPDPGMEPGPLETLAAEPTVRGRFVELARRAIESAADEDRLRLEAALRYGLAAFAETGQPLLDEESRG